MGKAAQRKSARHRTKFVVRVGYCDGSEEINGFADRDAAQKMVSAIEPMLLEPHGVDLVELVDRASGAVEFRAVREVRHGFV